MYKKRLKCPLTVLAVARRLEVIRLIWQDLNLCFLVNYMIFYQLYHGQNHFVCHYRSDASETGSETPSEPPDGEQESIDCDDDKDQSANSNADPAEPGRTGFWCIQIILIIPQPINYNLYFDNEARIYISSSLL